MDETADVDVDDGPMRLASVASFLVVLGGLMFVAIGLVTALMADSDATALTRPLSPRLAALRRVHETE